MTFFSRLTSAVLLTLVAIVVAAEVSAQTYTRSQSTSTYTERTGTGISSFNNENYYSGFAKVVRLPFAFPFFNRTYRTAILNGSGQVAFRPDTGSTSNASLATPVADPNQHEAINVFRFSQKVTDFEPDAYTVHFESGRVVFQWKNNRDSAGEQLTRFNYQVHILTSGEIQLHFGPIESEFTDTHTFVSGIVNFGGTSAFAGFGNVLTQQTTLPTNGTVVTLVPSGFTQLAGVEVAPVDNPDSEAAFVSNQSDQRIGRFQLIPRGAGGTVSSIAVNHFFVGAGEPITLRLFQDNAPLGTFDGSDVQVGTTQSPSSTSVSTFGGLSEAITAAAVDYLVVASFGSLTSNSDSVGSTTVFGTGLTVSTVGWGMYASAFRHVSDGPHANVEMSQHSDADNPVASAGGNTVLASFEVRRGRVFSISRHERFIDFGTLTMTGVSVNLILSGLTIADISELRLYGDGGSIGVLDGSDPLLSTVTSPATTTVLFSSLAESVAVNGRDYLITFTLSGSYTGTGTVRANLNTGAFQASETAFQFTSGSNTTGTLVPVVGTTAVTYLARRTATHLTRIPANPSNTNLPACTFSLRTNVGTSNLTQLQFSATSDATTYLSAARLYIDAGIPGRFDGADTAIGGAGTIAATTITFGLAETITTTPVNYLLVVDIAAAATSATRFISLSTTGVTASVAAAGINSLSTALEINQGSANGVSITGFSMPSSVTVTTTPQVIAAIQLTPRGTGGLAPLITFDPIFAGGGPGNNCSISTIAVLEGAGPLGVLDATDRYIPNATEIEVDENDSVAILNNTSGGAVTSVRNILICAWTFDSSIDGPVVLAFRGFTAGTDVVWTSGVPAPTSTSSTISTGGGGGGGGGDGGDGGCSSGSGTGVNWLLMLGALAGLAVATRLRRSLA